MLHEPEMAIKQPDFERSLETGYAKMTATLRKFVLAASALTVLSAGFLGAAALPALAFDDKVSTFEPLLGAIGLGKDTEEKPDIDYRERPRLVVPKTRDLPPPQERGSTRASNWPKDQDLVRRREAAAAERVPRTIELNKNPVMDNHEMLRGRGGTTADAREEPCDTRNGGVYECGAITPVEKIKRVFSSSSDDKDEVVKPGVEPRREFLTEPPTGFRRATRNVQATTERPIERENSADSAAYYRDQARRNSNPDR